MGKRILGKGQRAGTLNIPSDRLVEYSHKRHCSAGGAKIGNGDNRLLAVFADHAPYLRILLLSGDSEAGRKDEESTRRIFSSA